MQVKLDKLDATKLKLNVSADQKIIDQIKSACVHQLGTTVKVPGFRSGKAPAQLIEKAIEPSRLENEFLEQAINHLYIEAVQHEKLRPVTQPQITITKFVPYTDLEFSAEFEAVGRIVLPDYVKIKPEVPEVKVTSQDVEKVLKDLVERGATRDDVSRAAKTGDEVTIDFAGTDFKTKEPIAGTDGTDYPLVLGSNSFIPGFEDALVGMKVSETKSFPVTFPKDYGATELQNKRVTFSVTVKAIKERKLPKIDNAFASTIGPFKTLTELKTDIKKQLEAENTRESRRQYDNALLEAISSKSELTVPQVLIEDEIDRMEEEEKRNVVYRGQTWQEHLAAEKLTEAAHREKQRPAAELRVKAGLVLGEITEKEQITVAPEELEIRIQLLKGQYQDVTMQAELDKPENRRDLMNRLLTEKTLDKLYELTTKK